jgi:2-keto-3-deoxy-L-rhamnonate aldolase RhmA
MTGSLAGALKAGEPLCGTVMTLPGAVSAEILAEPFDLVWVDLEHAALGPRDAQEVILGAQAAGAFALVRVPCAAYDLMTMMVDAGADGVVLANVPDAASISAARARMMHLPDGTRGWGPRRLGLRHRSAGRRHERPSLWVQIESVDAVDRVDEIVASPGLDAVVIGTADLSFAVGRPLDARSPEVIDAVATVRRACETVGVPFGVAGALDAAPPEIYESARVLVHSTDARLCATAVDSSAEWLRSILTTTGDRSDDRVPQAGPPVQQADL